MADRRSLLRTHLILAISIMAVPDTARGWELVAGHDPALGAAAFELNERLFSVRRHWVLNGGLWVNRPEVDDNSD